MGSLLGIANAKTIKGEQLGWMTGIMYMLPHEQSVPYGGKNVCPFATKGCSDACLVGAGRGRFDTVREARLDRTLRFFNDREKFLEDLTVEITKLVAKAGRKGMKPCVRLNGTSDLPWHRYGIVTAFPDIQFYDYTKNVQVALDFANGDLPKNYHITFSRSEENHADCIRVLNAGGNVAIVFDIGKNYEMVPKWKKWDVVDADKHDLRFLDGKGKIAGLRMKGVNVMKDSARASGFCIKPDTTPMRMK